MNPLAITSFVAFTAAVAVIAWWKTRREDLSHSTGYYLGGRSLGWVVIAGSLILTNISTEQMVGLNGNAYADGASVMAWEVVAVVAMVLMAWFFLPRYLSRGISTIPQYLQLRFGRDVRTVISAATLATIIVGFLPFVLYSGALALDGLFHVSRTLGWPPLATTIVLVVLVGLIGGAYSVLGGLKAVAVSDTINGVGLLAGGLLIPILGLIDLGDGSFLGGLTKIFTEHPERLSPLPPAGNPSAVPFSALFTGMFIINVNYWCMNQFIIQRTFGAKSLKDGQKGVLLAAGLKLVGVVILVLPGIIAYHLFGPDLQRNDLAYPLLVERVLPTWLVGFFGAVLLGAILSSFNSALHAASTLFGLDIYKAALRPAATDADAVRAGKIIGIVLMVLAMAGAPLIAFSSEGLFATMKVVISTPAVPIGAVVFAGIFLPAISARAAITTLVIGLLLQAGLVMVPRVAGWASPIHWLHITGINFAIMLVLMAVLSKTIFPPKRALPADEPGNEPADEAGAVDMTHSRAAIPAGVALIVLVVALYVALILVGR